MPRPTPTYRLLTAADVAIFRKVRARACREEPTAFLMTGEEIEQQSDKHFERHFANGWIAGAFLDGKLVGITGLNSNIGIKTRHKGMVWGVYVAPEARGHGCGKKMINMVLAEGEKAGLEVVTLSTDVSNLITVGLYKNLGFESYGVEEHILKLEDGRYIDDVWMIKYLGRDNDD